eukprot:scaffold326398_cov66-Tisochrysis_lutea.AAC.1
METLKNTQNLLGRLLENSQGRTTPQNPAQWLKYSIYVAILIITSAYLNKIEENELITESNRIELMQQHQTLVVARLVARYAEMAAKLKELLKSYQTMKSTLRTLANKTSEPISFGHAFSSILDNERKALYTALESIYVLDLALIRAPVTRIEKFVLPHPEISAHVKEELRNFKKEYDETLDSYFSLFNKKELISLRKQLDTP